MTKHTTKKNISLPNAVDDGTSALRKSIIDYVREHTSGSRVTVRQITRRFGINNEKFYEMFPNGIEQLYEEAGREAPRGRLEATLRATEARRKNEATSLSLVLPADMVQIVWGICHLEGGKEPLVVIKEMIDRDRKVRLEGITLENWKTILSDAQKWHAAWEALKNHRRENEDPIQTVRRLIRELDETHQLTKEIEQLRTEKIQLIRDKMSLEAERRQEETNVIELRTMAEGYEKAIDAFIGGWCTAFEKAIAKDPRNSAFLAMKCADRDLLQRIYNEANRRLSESN